MTIIDLRSDTVTKPSKAMLEIMMQADQGDEYYQENHTVYELENYCANFFKKEAALFFTSGTMANLASILAIVETGNELIIDASYHINYFASGQIAQFSGTILNITSSPTGIITEEELEMAIREKCRTNEGNRLI